MRSWFFTLGPMAYRYVRHDSIIHDMTQSYTTWLNHTWHDSIIHDMTESYTTWLNHTRHDSIIHDMTQSYMTLLNHTWYDSMIIHQSQWSHMTWLNGTDCRISTQSHLRHDECVCAPLLIHMSAISHSRVRHGVCTCVTWRHHTDGIILTHVHVQHEVKHVNESQYSWMHACTHWVTSLACTHWVTALPCTVLAINEYMYVFIQSQNSYVCWLSMKTCMYSFDTRFDWYGVASISRLLKIIGLFCKRALWKRRYSTKETYDFKEPTNGSHPIANDILMCRDCMCGYHYMSHVTLVNVSWHTHELDMFNMWMSHGTRLHQSYQRGENILTWGYYMRLLRDTGSTWRRDILKRGYVTRELYDERLWGGYH